MIEVIKKHSPLPVSNPQANFSIKGWWCVSIQLFDDIDEEKTRQNVDSLLSQYWHILRIVGTSYQPKVTATYKFDAVSHSNYYQNPIDSNLINQNKIWQILVDIWCAYNSLDAYERQLLYDKYLRKHRLADYLIYPKYGLSESTFYRNLKQASLGFAEAYRHGELLAFQNDRKLTEN